MHMRVTARPWPSEKSTPHQRPSRERASPSMATRWSGSKPWRTPSRKTSAPRASDSLTRGSFEKDPVPELFPALLLVEHGDRIDHGVLEAAHLGAYPLAYRRAAHRLEELLAFGREDEVDERRGGLRVRGILCDRDALRARDDRLDRDPVDRRALALQRLDIALVCREADRDFARGDELREEDVALAHVGLHLAQLAEEAHAALLAPGLDQGRHPLGVGRLDADASLPLRVEEAAIAGRQLGLAHLRGVVGDDEEIQAIGDPEPVLRDGAGGNVGEVRRLHGAQHLLPLHHIRLPALGFHHLYT